MSRRESLEDGNDTKQNVLKQMICDLLHDCFMTSIAMQYT